MFNNNDNLNEMYNIKKIRTPVNKVENVILLEQGFSTTETWEPLYRDMHYFWNEINTKFIFSV